MSESGNHPYGGRNQRPDDDTLPGERPVSEEERHVEPPGKRDDETASRAAEEGDPPGGSVANQSGRTPDRSPSVPSEHGKRRS